MEGNTKIAGNLAPTIGMSVDLGNKASAFEDVYMNGRVYVGGVAQTFSQWSNLSNNHITFLNNSGSFVGINTENPQYSLHVEGD